MIKLNILLIAGSQVLDINITQSGSLIAGQFLALTCSVETSLSPLSNSVMAYWEASPLLGTNHTSVVGETLMVELRFDQVRASMPFSYICHGSVYSQEQSKTVKSMNSVHLSLQGMLQNQIDVM